MSEQPQPVWWDSGRARWCARPERKQRSYEEPVGGLPRRSGEGLRRERHASRWLLARYRLEDEAQREHLEERLVAPLPSVVWSACPQPRREALRSAELRRLREEGRHLLTRGAFALPWRTCERLGALLARSPGDELFARLAELTEAQWTWRRWPFRSNRYRVGALSRSPLLQALAPRSAWLRRRAARLLLGALAEHSRAGRSRDASVFLEALCTDHGRLAALRARRLAWLLGDHGEPLARELRTSHDEALAELLLRALEEKPSLRERVEGWLRRHR